MAGHSHFKNIMRHKGKQDAARGKIFTKLAREIIVSAKAGSDPAYNARLRAAIAAARAENMTRDRIENAIKKGAGELESESFDEVRYEGYAGGGIALIVEGLTDNKNRTASNVRAAFTKYGGNMGSDGSVAFMFDRVGLIEFKPEAASEDAMLEAAIEAGADNCESSEYGHEITCAPDDLNTVREALSKKFGDPSKAKFAWKAQTNIAVDAEQAASLMKLIEVLEEDDDVQEVFGNYEIPDDVAKKLAS